ncbi:MAG: hypothetical protein JKY37_19405 [Nannocystaceae bacterium]|nr:hypothetical protein [Nannocystaceae bacterium]
MRRMLPWIFVAGCGPTITVDDGGGAERGGAETSSTSDGSRGSTSGDPVADDGDSSTSATETSTETSTSNGSTGEPFQDSDVLGGWLCTGESDPFFMEIADYTSPQQLTGQVCASWNGAQAPQEWAPCAPLSSHPIGDGPMLWIFAMIDEASKAWTVSAWLTYDPASDSMEGQWQGPGVPMDATVACTRVL